MKLSVLRCAEKFVAKRITFYGKKYDMYRQLGPNVVVGVASLLTAGAIIYNFGYPTPDLQHDMRLLGSPNYRRYVETNGMTDHDAHLLDMRIRGFKVKEQEIGHSRMLQRTNMGAVGYMEL